MYKVDKNVKSEGSNLNFIDVGIHENVYLTDIRIDISKNGNEFIAFTFEKDEQTLIHTEYKPKDVDAQKLEDKTKNQIKRFKHIITKYISEDAYTFEAGSFKEFCEGTVKLLGDTYKGKPVRIKATYSNNNYVTLPPYTPFIETMDISAADSKLKLSSIDKLTKSAPDAEVPVTNPLNDLLGETEQTETPKEAGLEDLPF